MTIDIAKKYRTRNGRDVRILCTDAPGMRPVIGYIIANKSNHVIYSWHASGRSTPELECDFDLVEVREKRRLSGFENVYSNGVSARYTQRGCADNAAAIAHVTRIACIDLSRIEYEVGEGLE